MKTTAKSNLADRNETDADRNIAGKRIVLYGMNFSPEITGVGKYTGEIADYLAGQKADVTVVTTPPHYPGWAVKDGYSNRYSTEHKNGMKILRVPLFLKENMSGIWRLIAPMSFAATSAPVVLWQILRNRPHFVICVEPTLFAAPLAILASKIIGARTVLHVQDLEVDAAFAVGHLKSLGFLKKLGYLFEKVTLKGFDRIITISSRMAERLVAKTGKPSQVAIVRNWVDLGHIYPLGRISAYRHELGYADDDFIVLYSGNIGAKQGLDTLLDAAERLVSNKKIRFIIAGEGPAKRGLVEKYGKLENVSFLPFQPYEKFNEFMNLASLHALPQERGAADLVLPSKLGGMLASGIPVVVTAEPGTELAEFLGDSAIITPPGDAHALARAIEKASHGDREDWRERQADLSRMLSKEDGCISFINAVTG
ncbi:WcaI family glycosyltransferase [Rhizobium alvei]|uniref:WcaI family glycosyltransferase n=1 Tax=Rhizobium alvei TaxID=1132659 RepID=A0ABT8YL71_9HYPH|nr:WcaI family glycosyltransferase [Rhizobium alvei]MDO6963970.1 WcaI family glycosyltransferase [Rhizobium alvei]